MSIESKIGIKPSATLLKQKTIRKQHYKNFKFKKYSTHSINLLYNPNNYTKNTKLLNFILCILGVLLLLLMPLIVIYYLNSSNSVNNLIIYLYLNNLS